jgi:hypothetical protein
MTTSPSQRAFATGAISGLVASIAMIATDTLNVIFTPLWQRVLFYPGFVVGGSLWDCCERWFDGTWAEGYGVLAVALSYGLIALAGHRVWVRFRRT